MSYGKYIIIEHAGCEIGIMFDNLLEHATMAANKKPIAAGFFTVHTIAAGPNDENVSVWGKSVTLNLSARIGTDEKILRKICSPL